MVRWRPTPQYKIEEGGGTTYTNDQALNLEIVRAENNISYAVLSVNDYMNKNYVSVFDVLDTLDLSLRYGSDAWTKVFAGQISSVRPIVSKQYGETLTISAWGKGLSLIKTHCNDSYGTESENPTLDTFQEIVQHLITNHINADFDGNNTHWGIADKTENLHSSFSITNLSSPFLDNFTLINRLCDLVNAYAQGLSAPEVSCHWYMDTAGQLYAKKIDADHSDSNWDQYWRTNAAGSTIEVAKDMILYDFQKHVEEYANKVAFCTNFRKPAYDIWTEDGGPIWATSNANATYDNAQAIVDSHSLKLEPTATPVMGLAWLPGGALLTVDAAAAQPDVTLASVAAFKVGDSVRLWDNTPLGEEKVIDSIAGNVLTMTVNLTNAYAVANAAACMKQAKWDFTKCGSHRTVPKLNYYVQSNNVNAFGYPVYLFTEASTTNGILNDYFYAQVSQFMTPRADKWIHLSIPIGPYYALDPKLQLDTGADEFEWNIVGNADWSEINGIALLLTGNNLWDKWFDDLHFSGKIIRTAEDTSEIDATNKMHQLVIRNDLAVDDTLIASDDSGTPARLCYAELLRRAAKPTVGRIQVPLIVDILPGQWVHIHAARKSDGSFRIDRDFRCKEIRHRILGAQGATTILNLTDDTTNSHAFSAPDQWSLLKDYTSAMRDNEAKNLKVSGIDWTIPRLAKAY